MRAWRLQGPLPSGWEQAVEKSWETVFRWEALSPSSLASGWVRLRLSAAALNRRDAWIVAGLYPGIKYPVTLGSDGAGHIETLGPSVEDKWDGQLVLINPSLDWGPDARVQGEGYHIIGLPTDGTFATHVDVPATQVHVAPKHLTTLEAAALPLAGLTAYRALFVQGALEPGEKVLIPGIGGGVATLALQLAVAQGAQVWVTSSHPDKLAIAQKLGAAGGVLYTEPDWATTLAKSAGPFDLVLDGVVGDIFPVILEKLLAPAGRYVIYGATRGNPPRLDVRRLFWRQHKIIGSTMGSPADFEALLHFVAQHQIRPYLYRVFPLRELVPALVTMWRGQAIGKIVLDCRSGLES